MGPGGWVARTDELSLSSLLAPNEPADRGPCRAISGLIFLRASDSHSGDRDLFRQINVLNQVQELDSFFQRTLKRLAT